MRGHSTRSDPTTNARAGTLPETPLEGPTPIPADTPLDVVSDKWTAAGFDGQFRAELGGLLRCLTCGEVTPAAEQHADDVTRLEGASDPADMTIVIPVQCSHCGTRGIFISNFGPEASEAEADVLLAFQRHAPYDQPGARATDAPRHDEPT